MWLGSEDIADAIGNYVMKFGFENAEKDFWAGIIDPRYAVEDVMAYITELGGTVFAIPEE